MTEWSKVKLRRVIQVGFHFQGEVNWVDCHHASCLLHVGTVFIPVEKFEPVDGAQSARRSEVTQEVSHVEVAYVRIRRAVPLPLSDVDSRRVPGQSHCLKTADLNGELDDGFDVTSGLPFDPDPLLSEGLVRKHMNPLRAICQVLL